MRGALVFAAMAIGCSRYTSPDDAPTDAGAPNPAPVPVDSGVDSAVTTFCTAQSAIFCADFDEDTDFRAGWEKLVSTGGQSTVETSATVFDSAPRAFHVDIMSGSSEAALERPFTLNQSLTFALDARFPSLPQAPGKLAPVTLTTGDTKAVVNCFVDSGESYFEADTGMGNTAVLSTKSDAPSLDDWHHVVITITNLGGQTQVDASFDHAANFRTQKLPFTWAAGTEVILSVGVASLASLTATGAEAYVDNVLVTGD